VTETTAGGEADIPLDAPPEEAATGAPPVVAVVVTHDAGPWLEECLAALGASDYPNLSVLVVDADSAEDPTARVAAVLPSAYVRRIDHNPGYGAAANEVLEVVEGASHFVFLHDDAAPAPDAIRLLVEEAFRSNAGVVAPKVVSWDDPMLLLAVGMAADKTGHASAYGRGELDQEQHDAVRDVFAAPGGCQLVRADLFHAVGGFDPAITMLGEDVDLCWRAQVAGARVVVAPSAMVRHVEATASGVRELEVDPPDAHVLELRHRVRTVLKAYGFAHRVRVVPQMVAVMVFEAALAGRAGWRAFFDAWRWNLRETGSSLRAARRDVQRHRLVRDGDVRRLQTRSTRFSTAVRTGLDAEERTFGMGEAGRRLAWNMTRGGIRLTMATWASVALVLVGGSRHLLGERLPAVGQFVPFPGGPSALLRAFWSGWRTAGLGSESPAPLSFLLLGLGGIVTAGGMGVLQKVVVLGALPLGIIGVHRLTAPLGAWRAQLLSAALYAAVPLPYDALGRGRWSALVAYGTMPWLLSRLLRATGLAPFGAPAPVEEGRKARRRRRRAARSSRAQDLEALFGAEAGTLDAIDAEELRVATGAVSGHHDDRPGDDDDDVPATPPGWVRIPGSFRDQAVAAALATALAVAFAPPVAAALLLAGVGVFLGSLLAGPVAAGARALAMAAVAVAGAALLLVPWTFELVAPGSPAGGILGIGPPPSAAPRFGELLRLHVGPMALGAASLGLLVAAALPLAVGRGWRLEWATRCWSVALVSIGVTWAAGRGWLGVQPPAPDVLLAPAAVAVVLAVALGLAAFEMDLRDYHFGWRQVASVAAAVAATAALLPVHVAALDGRWGLPPRDYARLLAWMPDQARESGDFRVLWVGAPGVLPGDGWRISSGVSYAVSRNGAPEVFDLWPGSDQGATGLVADALAVARQGETTRLGRLLGPFGVRYVAVPREAAPANLREVPTQPPLGLLDALAAQVDLRQVHTDEALVLFENAAWADAAPDAARTRPVGTPAGFRTSPVRWLALLLELALWVAALWFVIANMRRRSAALR
jgi:GT2 family glycosyltransferase